MVVYLSIMMHRFMLWILKKWLTEYIKAKMLVSDLWFLEKNIWSSDINRFTAMLLCLPENVILSNISRVRFANFYQIKL
jgi:hypothetical protein